MLISATQCQECGRSDVELKEWQSSYYEGRKYFCSVECAKSFSGRIREKEAQKWLNEFIPRAYRYSDPAKLPDQEGAKLVMEFEPEEPFLGFYIYGETGAGKTRSLVMRLKQYVLSGEEPVIYIRGKQFGDEVVERTRPNGKGGFTDWFDTLKRADILAIDEVDKVNFSDRVRAEFFELVESRVSEEYPILFVAQCSVDRLVEKIGKKGKEESAGIIRRIKENCLPIHFTP